MTSDLTVAMELAEVLFFAAIIFHLILTDAVFTAEVMFYQIK